MNPCINKQVDPTKVSHNRFVQSQRTAMPILLGMAKFAALPRYNPSQEYVHASVTNYRIAFLCNESPFINRIRSHKIEAKMVSPPATRKVVGTPLWLKQRMETLRQMPPPTLQEVRTQLAASAEIRKKLTDKQSV